MVDTAQLKRFADAWQHEFNAPISVKLLYEIIAELDILRARVKELETERDQARQRALDDVLEKCRRHRKVYRSLNLTAIEAIIKALGGHRPEVKP